MNNNKSDSEKLNSIVISIVIGIYYMFMTNKFFTTFQETNNKNEINTSCQHNYRNNNDHLGS